MLRGSLISGLSLLLAIALTEALAAAKSLRPRSALALGILASIVVAAISVPVRLWVVGAPVQQRLTEEFTYRVLVCAVGDPEGSLAYWLFNSTREDELARARLKDRMPASVAAGPDGGSASNRAAGADRAAFSFQYVANVRLYETAPAQGQEMLASLINYFRAALPSMRQSGSTLARELELARSFLTILKMRMRERLTFSIDHDPALENAAHGAADAGGKRDQAWTVAVPQGVASTFARIGQATN